MAFDALDPDYLAERLRRSEAQLELTQQWADTFRESLGTIVAALSSSPLADALNIARVSLRDYEQFAAGDGASIPSEATAEDFTIRGRRRSLGMTQEELAALSGLSRQYIGVLERDRAARESISLAGATRIAQALGLSVRILFAEAYAAADEEDEGGSEDDNGDSEQG